MQRQLQCEFNLAYLIYNTLQRVQDTYIHQSLA